MTGAIFRWARAQRYPCVVKNTDCANDLDLDYFARSEGTLRHVFQSTW